MSRIFRIVMVGLAVLGVATTVGCSKQGTAGTKAMTASPAPETDSGQITIAIAGMVTPKSGLKYYKGLADYMGKAVGKSVRIIHKADYSQVNTMLKEGSVDVAFVCSGPYVAGHDAFGLELVAAPVVNGRAAYYCYIIVPKSSEATSLASLRGKTFAFTDPESNTGYIVPNYLLSKMGLDAKTFFKKTLFTYGHDNSIRTVAESNADGAGVDSLIFDFQAATNPLYTSKVRIVQKSEEFAIPPVVARPGLAPEIVDGVRDALLKADKDPTGKALLEKMKIERFITIDDSAYDSIRRMDEAISK